MATSIFFNGRLISIPGSYSEVDASGLEQIGLGASGIVALVGEAEGGRPADSSMSVDDFLRFTKPEAIRATFRSGDLREAGGMLFEPSTDPDILGGAQEVVAMKVNPATQSTATLSNAQGDALGLTSNDYGAFTSQINITIADGSSQGKLVTIIFEDITESEDNIGGDNIFTLEYEPPTSNGWETATSLVNSSGDIVCDATRDEVGLDGDITAQPAAATNLEILSSAAGDTSKEVTIWGLDGSNNPIKEVITTNATDGTTVVEGSTSFTKITGAKADGTSGTITIRHSSGAPDYVTVAADSTKGRYEGSAMYANGAITIVADAAEANYVVIEGLSATGAVQYEAILLNGATPVTGSSTFSEVTGVLMGLVAAARTVTISAEAAKADYDVQDNIQKAADYFNAKQIIEAGPATKGFVFTIITGETEFDLADLDVSVSASSIYNTALGFKADLYAIIDWINNNSDYITAAKATGASGGAPSNQGPTFLSGGSEGTTTTTEWQTALNLLKQVRVNSIVIMSGNPAVHAMVKSHCVYMGGIGRNERDAFVGLLNTAMDDVPTKTEAKSQIVDINSRYVRAFAQSIERFHTDGTRTTFMPMYQAAIAAGMQAGSPVGTSLTFKYGDVLGFSQDTTWNPVDDSEEMIQAGLCFMENVEGVGRRWVRNITTHLIDNNIAYIEGSVHEAVLYATYNFRTEMEFAVGKKGFSGTVNAADGKARGILQLMVDEEILVQYRALNIELIVDVLEVSCEIAPVVPINFVKNTIHLVTVRQTA